MTPRPLTVTPIYGYGWFEGTTPMDDVPMAFEIGIDSRIEQQWRGHVLTAGHPFHGRLVELFQRHTEWSGTVNVTVRPANGKIDGIAASGFAMLDRHPTEVR